MLLADLVSVWELACREVAMSGAGDRREASGSPPPRRERSAVEVERTPTARWRTLPSPIGLRDMRTSQETVAAPDPEGGRNPERDFLLRYAGGF
jgi:hypothetical protein